MTILDTQHTRSPEVRRWRTNVDTTAVALTETDNMALDPPADRALPAKRPKAIGTATPLRDRSHRSCTEAIREPD